MFVGLSMDSETSLSVEAFELSALLLEVVEIWGVPWCRCREGDSSCFEMG